MVAESTVHHRTQGHTDVSREKPRHDNHVRQNTVQPARIHIRIHRQLVTIQHTTIALHRCLGQSTAVEPRTQKALYRP
jgi:hypothetical protein